ncbi:hypothetical protein BDM02DRAFT_1562813 [Thelephora ganbajun]|uniref:Uncharacterized protein n=1 Tax=Thelephora ganbajun TaxID=370292 RepID=A0ACB6ZW55_THEGA|nr:hypothetical protein BDM02DRAFT_1562813 [Thelephora ganbajun]
MRTETTPHISPLMSFGIVVSGRSRCQSYLAKREGGGHMQVFDFSQILLHERGRRDLILDQSAIGHPTIPITSLNARRRRQVFRGSGRGGSKCCARGNRDDSNSCSISGSAVTEYHHASSAGAGEDDRSLHPYFGRKVHHETLSLLTCFCLPLGTIFNKPQPPCTLSFRLSATAGNRCLQARERDTHRAET